MMTFGKIETVGELIDALQHFNPEIGVKVDDDGNVKHIQLIEGDVIVGQYTDTPVVKISI
jgi:hypothetical protein